MTDTVNRLMEQLKAAAAEVKPAKGIGARISVLEHATRDLRRRHALINQQQQQIMRDLDALQHDSQIVLQDAKALLEEMDRGRRDD